jgi:glycosyltransferase involved in cell wall biosynthesis
VPRLLNGLSTYLQRGDVNHITGDIHYVALFLPGRTTILTIHDCGALERLTGLKRWLMKLFWFDLPARRAKYLTVISEEAKRQLLRHIRVADSKVVVIPDMVSPIYRPCPRRFNEDYPRILHVGTTVNKNLSRLVVALRGIACHLHIIGHLSSDQLREIRAAGIDVTCALDLSQMQMYESYCAADLVSFVSTYEGFGLPILEANAVGRPVVTSNLSSMPEVAGDAACLVDPYDIASIRSGILRTIEDRDYREQLIRSGYDNVQRYLPEQIASKYIELYRRVCADIRPSSTCAVASRARQAAAAQLRF